MQQNLFLVDPFHFSIDLVLPQNNFILPVFFLHILSLKNCIFDLLFLKNPLIVFQFFLFLCRNIILMISSNSLVKLYSNFEKLSVDFLNPWSPFPFQFINIGISIFHLNLSLHIIPIILIFPSLIKFFPDLISHSFVLILLLSIYFFHL